MKRIAYIFLPLLSLLLPALVQAQTPDSTRVYSITEAELSRAIESGVRKALEARETAESESPRDSINKTPLALSYQRYMDKQQRVGRRIQRVDRNAMRSLFVPKGQWMFGGSIAFNEWDKDNMNELVLKNMDFKGHTLSASPYVCYFVTNNLAVGARFHYTRYFLNLSAFDLNLGEDFNISLKDLYYLEHSFEAGPFARFYVPIGQSKVFAFFAEARLTYTYGKGKNTSGTGTEFDGSFEHVRKVQLGVCPGMTAFVADFMAVECSVGMMGVNYKWTDQKTNRVEAGRSRSGGANFSVNLLSINIGVSFYL